MKSEAEQLGLMSKAFQKLGKVLTKTYVKAFVLLATAGSLGCGMWGLALLETRFESIWFLPETSYLRQWFDAKQTYFPGNGEQVCGIPLHEFWAMR